jgi:hypothetical protein
LTSGRYQKYPLFLGLEREEIGRKKRKRLLLREDLGLKKQTSYYSSK